MYNRYIRGESGAYTRIPEEEHRTSPSLPRTQPRQEPADDHQESIAAQTITTGSPTV